MPGLLINIDVEDLGRAEAFYCAALALRPGRRFQGVVELLGGDAPIYLIQQAAGSLAAGGMRRGYARHWTPVHVDFVVSDLDAAVERATAAGAGVEDLRDEPWGRIAPCADPFGNGFCLIQFGDAGYDAIALPADSNRRPAS